MLLLAPLGGGNIKNARATSVQVRFPDLTSFARASGLVGQPDLTALHPSLHQNGVVAAYWNIDQNIKIWCCLNYPSAAGQLGRWCH